MMLLIFSFVLAGCDFFGQTTTTTTTISETETTTTTTGEATETTTTTTSEDTETTTTTTSTTTTTGTTTTTSATTTTTTTLPTTTTTTGTTTTTSTGGTVTTTTAVTTTTTTPTTTTTSVTTTVPTTTTTTVTTTTTPTTTTTTVVTTTPTTTTTTVTTTTSEGTTTTQTTTPTTTVTTETTTTGEPFDRQDLINLIITKAGGEVPPTEQEIEAQIAMFKTLFGTASEEDLYNLLLSLDTILSGFDLVTTLTEFQNWYLNAKALGFDKTIVTNMMVNFLQSQINNDVANFDPNHYTSMIADLQAGITQNLLDMAQLRTNLVDYCTNATTNTTECIAFYDAYTNEFNLYQDYQNMLNDYENNVYKNQFNYNMYQSLEWNLQDNLNYTYYNINPVQAQLSQDAFDTIYNSLSSEEKAMFDPILAKYELYATVMYRDRLTVQDFLYTVYDNNFYPVASQVYNLYSQYENLGHMNNTNTWMIQEYTNNQARDLQQHQLMLAFQTYFGTEAGASKLKLLMITIYDVLDSVILGTDQNTFDLVMGILTGSVKPSPDMLTSSNIVLYSGMVADVLTLVRSTIDTDDLNNIKSLAKDLVGIYIGTLDMPVLDQAALLIQLEAAIDQYVDVFFNTYDDLVSFLNSIDTAKADAIIEFIMLMTNRVESDAQMVIAIASLIDTLVGDESIDLNQLANNLCEIYFDVQYMFNPDETVVANVKVAMNANLDRVLELAAIIKNYDPLAIDAQGLMNINEFKVRVEAFAMMFSQGFESILAPIDYSYDYQDFVDLVRKLSNKWLTDEDAAAQIQMFMDILGSTDEEFTYYTVLMVFQYVGGIQSIQSFTEFQHWFAQVNQLGFSNSEIAGYIVSFLVIKIDQDVNYNTDYDTYMQSLLDQIANYQDMIDTESGYPASVEVMIADAIALLPTELQANAQAYWQAKLDFFQYSDAANAAYDQAYWMIGNGMVNGLLDSWRNYQYYLSIEDSINATNFYNNFHSMYDYLSPDQKTAVDNMLSTQDTFAIHRDNVFGPLQLIMDGNALYNPFLTIVYNNAASYYYFTDNTEYYQQMINSCNDEIQRLIADRAQLLLIETYLSDTEKQQLIQDVITILLDEVENLVASADPATFDIVFNLLMNGFKTTIRNATQVEVVDPIGGYFSDIDFSALAILGYTEDVSTVLKALFSTMSVEDMVKVKTLLFDFLQIQFTTDGMSQSEIDAALAQYSIVFDKYWPMLNEAIGVLTDMMDGMTEAKIQLFLDNVPLLFDSNPNSLEEVIAVSKIIDALLADGTFDIQALIDIYVEVYFDMNYNFDYLTSDMEAIQDIFATHINALKAAAAIIKDYDPANLTLTQVQIIFEAQKLAKYLVGCLQNPESISLSVSFAFEHQDFVSILQQMSGGNMSTEEAESQITMLMAIFEKTEEETFYMVLTYGMALMTGIQNVMEQQTIESARAFLVSVFNMGITKAEMAHYLVNFLTMMAEQRLADNSILTEYDNLINQLDQAITDKQTAEASYNQYLADIQAIIDAISDPAAKALAQQLWDQGLFVIQNDIAYGYALDVAMKAPYFREFTCNQLLLYYFGDSNQAIPADMESFNNLFYSLSYDEQVLYNSVIGAYNNVLNAFAVYQSIETSLEAYGLYAPNMQLLVTFIHDARYTLLNLDDSLKTATFLVEDLNRQLENAYNNVQMYHFLELFFADPTNIPLLEQSIVLLLDEAENLITNANLDTIYFIMDLVQGRMQPGVTISTAGFLTKIQATGVLLGLLTQTLDAADLDTLHALINEVLYDYLNAFGDNETQTLAIINVVNVYYNGALGFIPLFSSFLTNMTEPRLQTIIDQVATLESVGNATDPLSNFIRAVAIANIIEAVSLDPSINTDNIIATALGAVFDIQYALGFVDSTTTADKVLSVQTAVTAAITTGLVIVDFNPYTVNEAQIMQIEAFKVSIDSFINLMNTLMNPNPQPA